MQIHHSCKFLIQLKILSMIMTWSFRESQFKMQDFSQRWIRLICSKNDLSWKPLCQISPSGANRVENNMTQYDSLLKSDISSERLLESIISAVLIQHTTSRQHCRLSICFHFCWAWQTLRRLRWPPESGCGIFEEPQLNENLLQITFFLWISPPTHVN